MTITGLNNLNKSTASNFELYFPKIPTSDSIKDMQSVTLNIFETVVPSLTLDVMEAHWQGGIAKQDSGGLSFENWYVNFTVDSNFQNWYSLYKWITFINNNKDRYGRPQREYKVDAVLRVLDNFRNEIIVISLTGCWISMLGEIKFTYREGDRNLMSSANLIYDRYEVRNIN